MKCLRTPVSCGSSLTLRRWGKVFIICCSWRRNREGILTRWGSTEQRAEFLPIHCSQSSSDLITQKVLMAKWGLWHHPLLVMAFHSLIQVVTGIVVIED